MTLLFHLECSLAFVGLGAEHIGWNNPFSELFLIEIAEIDSLLHEGGAVLVGGLGDMSSSIVANVRVQGSDEHQALVEEFINSTSVSFDASNAVKVEGFTGITKESCRVENIANDEWLEDIKFEMSAHSSNADSSVVTDDLGADHSNSFTLSGVNLARHDGRSGLVLWERELTETASRSRSQETDIVSNLHYSTSETIQGAM